MPFISNESISETMDKRKVTALVNKLRLSDYNIEISEISKKIRFRENLTLLFINMCIA